MLPLDNRRKRSCAGLDALIKMINLKEGQKAPDFELKDSNGKKVKLSDFKGKKVVLYFYPKDDTSGCTKQACDIRDNYSEVKKKAVILGVSPDDEKSHVKFAKKYSLPFTLLADVDKKVSTKYGVYGEKTFMGRKFMGITRSTFIIDEKGKIKKIMYKVDAKEHINDVMPYLNS